MYNIEVLCWVFIILFVGVVLIYFCVQYRSVVLGLYSVTVGDILARNVRKEHNPYIYIIVSVVKSVSLLTLFELKSWFSGT